MSVKHRQPKPAPSHTESSPEEGSAIENTQQADTHQAPVVQKLDSAIHRVNLYPVDNAIGFPNTYPLDSDLSGG